MTDDQMTAPQLNALAKYQAELTRRLLGDIDLRKQAMGYACQATAGSQVAPEQFLEVAEAIHDFLLKGVAQIDPRASQAS